MGLSWPTPSDDEGLKGRRVHISASVRNRKIHLRLSSVTSLVHDVNTITLQMHLRVVSHIIAQLSTGSVCVCRNRSAWFPRSISIAADFN
jgi:hypothetical protein